MEKVGDVLGELPEGSRVGVVTLLGSLCPITLGHVQTFIEARRLLLGEAAAPRPRQLEQFDAVLGFISLNGEHYVERKLKQKGEASVSAAERQLLVELAVQDYPWLAWESHEGGSMTTLSKTWPHLSFVHFYMNGADDVVRHRKYAWAGPECRMITMGRPGDTEQAIQGARLAGVDLDMGFFIMGPELPDISSSQARQALVQGHLPEAANMLDPRVLEWCVQHGPWRPTGSK